MRTIDCHEPEGNAFCIVGAARTWATQLGKDADAICDEMMSGDYENLCRVFEREFSNICTLVNPPWDDFEEDYDD